MQNRRAVFEEIFEAHGLIGTDDPLPPPLVDVEGMDEASGIVRDASLTDIRRIIDEFERRRLAACSSSSFDPSRQRNDRPPAPERAAVNPVLPDLSSSTEAMVKELETRCRMVQNRVGPATKSFAATVLSLYRVLSLLHPAGADECCSRVDDAMRFRIVPRDSDQPSSSQLLAKLEVEGASSNKSSSESSSTEMTESVRQAVRLLKDISSHLGELEDLASRMATLQPLHCYAVARADSILRLEPSAASTIDVLSKASQCAVSVDEAVRDSRQALRESLESFNARLARIRRAKK